MTLMGKMMITSKTKPSPLGTVYGRLTVIEHLGTRENKSWVKCMCECGNEKEVRDKSLKKGRTKSCGCLNYELNQERKIRGVIHKRYS